MKRYSYWVRMRFFCWLLLLTGPTFSACIDGSTPDAGAGDGVGDGDGDAGSAVVDGGDHGGDGDGDGDAGSAVVDGGDHGGDGDGDGDGGSAVVDGGDHDSGSPDGGDMSNSDGGTPVVDSGTPLMDAGALVIDAGAPSADAGTPAADAGVPVGTDGGSGAIPTVCDVVQQVFESSCTSCHQGSYQIDLRAEAVTSNLVNQESALYGGQILVVPGDPENSLLYRKLVDDLESGNLGAMMPTTGMLGQSEIQLVHDWIEGGASVDCEQTQLSEIPDPGFKRLTKEQFNRALSELHGMIWKNMHAKADGDPSWYRDEEEFYDIFTSQNWGYWGDYDRTYPEDNQTSATGEPRGGYRRLDQIVFDSHLASWTGAIMNLARDTYENWVGKRLVFQACEADNDNGITNYATEEELINGCVDAFISDFGHLAFRRPLTTEEHVFFRQVYDDSETAYPGETFNSFSGYPGWHGRALSNVIAVINSSPEFLYQVEVGDEEGNLLPYELANRLSFHFWNTMPDAELFDAAADGSLMTEEGYAAQVDRLAADPKAARSVEEFYEDYFRVQLIPDINAQDGPSSYHGGPSWNQYQGRHNYIKDAMEAELRNLGRWYTLEEPASYEEMFRSNLHLLECSPPPWSPEECTGAGPYSEWSLGFPDEYSGWDGVSDPVMLPESERAGLLTRMGVLAHDTAYARPIRRGLYIREALLCDPIPPPENCDVVKPPEIDVYMTVRERVESITEQPGTSCADCHSTLINGFGHALGHFSSKGNYWETERMFSDQTNAEGDYWYFLLPEEEWSPIDAIGTTYFQGAQVTVDGAHELADLLATSGELETCWSRQYFQFAMGRSETASDVESLDQLASSMREGATMLDAYKAIAYLPQFKMRERPASTEGGQP